MRKLKDCALSGKWQLRILLLTSFLILPTFSFLIPPFSHLLPQTSLKAQTFYNLTADEVRVDSVLPLFTYQQALGSHYSDSIYTISLEYPEFIDMQEADILRYQQIAGAELPPAMPVVNQYIGVSRRQGTLYASFCPIVFRDGKYQKLVSFMVKTYQTPQSANASARSLSRSRNYSPSFSNHSVLASGRWVKILVPETGIYELSTSLIRQAGFSDKSKVKVFGYGGAWQPEQLTADYLAETDDLKEVPTCNVDGRRLFYAVGPVGWSSNTATSRTRNPYSDYGYYFLTEDGEMPQTVDSAAFVGSFYPSANDYHTLYEVDDYSWFHGGRNLYESTLFQVGRDRTFSLKASSATGKLTVVMSYDATFQATVAVNGKEAGTMEVKVSSSASTLPEGRDSYSAAAVKTWTFSMDNLEADNTVTIRQTSGGSMRLDYIQLCSTQPAPLPSLSTATLPVPEIVGQITNQDHHSDPQADMVIIIPTSQQMLAQAQRLAEMHKEQDGLRVNIVPADELYNEFSSGTPDANAYRRYMKMLYDRAESEADMPRYLLLMGDGAWDNRMVSTAWRNYDPDEFLLCYESDNSFSETDCYVSDDYFCMLDDGEGGRLLGSDRADVAVGRFPVRTAAEAKVMVDKAISYRSGAYAGSWQNTLCFMADDGNNNMHMADMDTSVVRRVVNFYPDYNIQKIYWDAYIRSSSATGFSYPDVTRLIKQQMQSGALVMNYMGHGAPYCLSHEQVVKLSDFAAQSSMGMPLWVTASCDIMPFDGQEENIGETSVLNSHGGAIAFFGTTRTVYAHYNRYMNKAFMTHVLGRTDGVRNSIGEAVRLAKNELISSGSDLSANKLQYTLLGDPALTLAAPTLSMVVDSINGLPLNTTNTPVTLPAGKTVTVSGHIDGSTDFNGVATATVRDVEQTITCKMNDDTALSTFSFKDRPSTLYTGSDSVRQGRFRFVFALPKDISYSDATGLINLFAVNTGKDLTAHGRSEDFNMTADTLTADNSIGPSIYCYLNSPSFTNGDRVNATPYFYAELNDKDGINASGSGIGHNLELIVDGLLSRTYYLNDYFQYDFGDYRSGHVGFTLPELAEGQHRLLFRAWDMLNNSSTSELNFTVSKQLSPGLVSVSCTDNPAKTHTTFLITHDRAGAEINVELDIFDTSGRQLWKHWESGVSTSSTYTVDWDLTTDGGHRLQTGVYLYRVRISTEGSGYASKSKKLIIMKR